MKQTFGNSFTWKPDQAQGGAETKRQLSASGREVFKLSLKAGAGAAVVAFYDAQTEGDANPSNQRWVLDASTTSNDNELFANPLRFEKGIFAVLEQGSGFNPVVCIQYMP